MASSAASNLGKEPEQSQTQSELERELNALPSADHDRSALIRYLERFAQRVGVRSILKLLVDRDRVQSTLQDIPRRMQLVTNQARLVVELIDDFAAGRYRELPWHSVALAALAILYSVSPADAVPDYLPGVGAVDDLVVIGIAFWAVRRELERYCRFKGYDVADYLPKRRG